MFSTLFPRPRKITATGGVFDLGARASAPRLWFCRGEWDGVPVHHAANARLRAAADASNAPGVRVEMRDGPGAGAGDGMPFAVRDASLPAGGYRLEVAPEAGLRVRAADPAGLLHALQTFAQLLRRFGARMPALVCEDAPAFPQRGFMLDISRCKVPTNAALEALVSQLSFLRINQLQLYTEHTYAFAGRREVWLGASPLDAADYALLRDRCAAHAIRLVPNLQSFGHVERWLRHRRYRHLAECPGGFHHELAGTHRPPGTLRPGPESLRFAGELHAEFLANFPDTPGAPFNIGGDEPWELGLGASRELCATLGKHAVYCGHLSALARSVEARGRRAQFWADILLEPGGIRHADTLPASAIPVLWGYDAGHPFEAQCAALAATGREYLVAPGTSAWQSLHGRLDNALANVREALAAALRHRADGILLTSWGDCGNHQPWPAFYPPLAAMAALAWNPGAHAHETTPDSAVLEGGIGAAFFDGDAAPARRLLRFGMADRFFTKTIRNKSLLWELLTARRPVLEGLLREVPERELSASLAHLEETLDGTLAADLAGGAHSGIRAREWEPARGVPAVDAELGASLALARLAVFRARAIRSGVERPFAAASARRQFRASLALYRAAWRRRAREGGLAESVSRITAAAC
ncbi:MAG: beta-N-acetylhexosaminidase [Puniceicoccales bacterium]|jgi:hypothetical protein|nr:beta-N-acetylhexosaminidase [Puniceicoccales bacterium]